MTRRCMVDIVVWSEIAVMKTGFAPGAKERSEGCLHVAIRHSG